MFVDGVELHVEVDGEGPALALFNGAMCTTRQWDGVIDRLAADRTVIRHDVRGTGASGPGPDTGYRFERYARDLLAVAEHFGIESFDLWGMAWGARVALVTAAEYPDRVRRLVLTDLAIDPADVDAQKAGGAAAKRARASAGIVDPPIPAGAHVHRDRETTGRALAATLLHRDLLPFVERVVAPTLIATGDHDPNLVSSRRALRAFADAEFVELELTGHGSVLVRPDAVTAVALAFLDRA